MWKAKHQIIKDAVKIYKIINKDDPNTTPYKKHKRGIKRFMKACRELQKYSPSLRIGEFDTTYSIDNYKNIKRFVIWYDYDDDIEDNEEFYGFVIYKEVPEGEDTKNFMYLKKYKDLNNFIKEVFSKEK